MLKDRVAQYISRHPDIARAHFHRPKYSILSEKIDPFPYLFLPFSKVDLSRWMPAVSPGRMFFRTDYSVSEGFFYSNEVRKVVKDAVSHGAIDFALPYYFPVVAPCSGYATSSYYTDESSSALRNRQKVKRFGIGYFVQIYNPPAKRYVQLGHLANVDKNIPFAKPDRRGNVWQPTIQNTPVNKMSGNAYFRWVEAGDMIGQVGYSGLTYEPDYLAGWERPIATKEVPGATWSIPHLHMDEFIRISGVKRFRRDPYGIYSEREAYPTHSSAQSELVDPIFYTDSFGLPRFVDS